MIFLEIGPESNMKLFHAHIYIIHITLPAGNFTQFGTYYLRPGVEFSSCAVMLVLRKFQILSISDLDFQVKDPQPVHPWSSRKMHSL